MTKQTTIEAPELTEEDRVRLATIAINDIQHRFGVLLDHALVVRPYGNPEYDEPFPGIVQIKQGHALLQIEISPLRVLPLEDWQPPAPAPEEPSAEETP